MGIVRSFTLQECMVAIVAEFAASKGGAYACASAFRLSRRCVGGAGGAVSGKVFKPGCASPGVLAGVLGAGLHRCGFVAGLPMRAGSSPVPLLGRARRHSDVGAGSRVCVCVRRLLCIVLVDAAGNVE